MLSEARQATINRTPVRHKNGCNKTALYFLTESGTVSYRATDIELLDGKHPKKNTLLICGNCGEAIDFSEPEDKNSSFVITI